MTCNNEQYIISNSFQVINMHLRLQVLALQERVTIPQDTLLFPTIGRYIGRTSNRSLY